MSVLATDIGGSAPSTGLFVVEMNGDNMEPTLRNRWDHVIAVAVQGYCGEGLYVLRVLGTDVIYQATSYGSGAPVTLTSHNPLYSRDREVPRRWFDENVVGMVVADIKVRDARLLRESAQ